jgi:hypothetical protein
MAMNKQWVIWNLKEAKEELDRTIAELESDPEYDYSEFSVAMSHLYDHLNTAWNAREARKQEVQECTKESFDRWRQTPDDIMS